MSLVSYVFDPEKVRPKIIGYVALPDDEELGATVFQVELSLTGSPNMGDPSTNTLIRELDTLASESHVRLKTPTYDGDAQLVTAYFAIGSAKGRKYTAELHSIKWNMKSTTRSTATTKIVVYVPEEELLELLSETVIASEIAPHSIHITR